MATNTTGATELIDTGERRDMLGRVVMPKERRAELVGAWRASGLTQGRVREARRGALLDVCALGAAGDQEGSNRALAAGEFCPGR